MLYGLESLKLVQSAIERYLKENTLHSCPSCSQLSHVEGVLQLKRNPSQSCTGCTLKFLLQRQRDVLASTTGERNVFHHWFKRRESNFDPWKMLFSFSLQNCLFVCYAWMSFRHMTSFCTPNKMSKCFRLGYFTLTNRLGLEHLIHQNLKFKAIKLCDFKMDLIKW